MTALRAAIVIGTVVAALTAALPAAAEGKLRAWRQGFVEGSARADLVAVVELVQIPEARNPQALEMTIVQVLAGEEPRHRIRVWCGVDNDHQSCIPLAASRNWVVSLVRATNGTCSERGYFLHFEAWSVLRVSEGTVTGRIADDDADADRERSMPVAALLDALKGLPPKRACITTR